jgi:hypothetical protein
MIGSDPSNHPSQRSEMGLPKMIDVGSRIFHRGRDNGLGQALSAKMIVCALGLSLALGAAGARSAQTAAAGVIGQTALDSTHPIRDLGDLPPPPDSDTSTPASASTVSIAEPVPELPIWAMLILCFAGLGLARFKRGRKDRLSPGLE